MMFRSRRMRTWMMTRDAGASTRRVDLARLRRARRAPQRRLGRLLVHGLPRRLGPDHERGGTARKERVRDGGAHAALVFDGDTASAGASSAPPTSCRGSRPAGLPGRPHALPDWRITCFFVDQQAPAPGGGRRRARRGRWPRSPGSAAARSRATPRMPRTARSPARSCTTARSAMFEQHGFERDPPDRQAPLGRREGLPARHRR